MGIDYAPLRAVVAEKLEKRGYGATPSDLMASAVDYARRALDYSARWDEKAMAMRMFEEAFREAWKEFATDEAAAKAFELLTPQLSMASKFVGIAAEGAGFGMALEAERDFLADRVARYEEAERARVGASKALIVMETTFLAEFFGALHGKMREEDPSVASGCDALDGAIRLVADDPGGDGQLGRIRAAAKALAGFRQRVPQDAATAPC